MSGWQDPIHVAFDITLAELFVSEVYVEDPGDFENRPSTSATPPDPRGVLAQRVADLVKAEVVDANLRTEILNAVKAELTTVVSAKVAEAMSGSIVVTGAWGAEPKTTTLNEMLRDELLRQLTAKPAGNRGLDKGQDPILYRIINEGIDRVLTSELTKEYDQAKKDVIKATREKAAEVMVAKLAQER